MSVDGRVQLLGSSRCDLRRSQDEEDEEDELRMLASLKREQDEGAGDMGGQGLSASQVGYSNPKIHHITLKSIL